MTVFYRNYVRLCNEKNVSISKAAEEAGFSRAAPSGWKNGAIPRDSHIHKLAVYFDCEPEELLGSKGINTGDDNTAPDTNLEVREALRRRPEMKILFDTALDAPTSAIYEAIATIMKSKEGKQ